MASQIPGIEAWPCNDGKYACTPRSADLSTPGARTYWRTLRHLRWSQLGYLALRRVLPRSASPARVKAPVGLRRIPGSWPFMEWQPETTRKLIAAREFTFLNRTVECHSSIPWNDRRHSKLWLYHLNYFDFLNVDFALPDGAATLEEAFAIALDWCTTTRKEPKRGGSRMRYRFESSTG